MLDEVFLLALALAIVEVFGMGRGALPQGDQALVRCFPRSKRCKEVLLALFCSDTNGVRDHAQGVCLPDGDDLLQGYHDFPCPSNHLLVMPSTFE